MHQNHRLNYLFRRYFVKEYTAQEREELMQYINDAKHDEQLQELIRKTWDEAIPSYQQDETMADQIFNLITGQPMQKPAPVRTIKNPIVIGWKRLAVAATILFFIAAPAYFFIFHSSNKPGSPTEFAGNIKNEIIPGGNK